MIALELVNLTDIVLRLATVAAILFLTFIIVRLFGAILRRALRSVPPLLADQAVKALSLFIWIIGLLLAVNQLGLNLDLLMVLIAIAGIALVVAARDVLSNIVSKVFMGSYVPVKVGDYLTIDGASGKVIEINQLAAIILLDDGSIATIPNAKFVKEVSVNKTSIASQRLSIPVSIRGAISLPRAEAELLKLAYKYKAHLDQRFPPIFTIKNRSSNFVEGELDLLVADPERREILSRELAAKINDVLERLAGEAASK
jgi:small-conductance mechanosensitive channel